MELSLLSQATLSSVGCISIHLVHGVRVQRSHSRGDVCCVSAELCVVSVRGEDLWVSSFKGGQHWESDRVQEGQCSEVRSSAHSRGQPENQM